MVRGSVSSPVLHQCNVFRLQQHHPMEQCSRVTHGWSPGGFARFNMSTMSLHSSTCTNGRGLLCAGHGAAPGQHTPVSLVYQAGGAPALSCHTAVICLSLLMCASCLQIFEVVAVRVTHCSHIWRSTIAHLINNPQVQPAGQLPLPCVTLSALCSAHAAAQVFCGCRRCSGFSVNFFPIFIFFFIFFYFFQFPRDSELNFLCCFDWRCWL